MTNKKFFVSILALALVLSMFFAGCGKNSDDNEGEGKLIITDIPSEFNDNYAVYIATLDSGDFSYIGCDILDLSTGYVYIYTVKISDGTVVLPMWCLGRGSSTYSGTKTVENGYIEIWTIDTIIYDEDFSFDNCVAKINLGSIEFYRGGAEISAYGCEVILNPNI